MKIGIVTFHAARNYGAVLQAYALQTHLAQAGHEPFLIDYEYRFERRRHGLSRWIGRTPRKTAGLAIVELLNLPFVVFQKAYLNTGHTHYTDYRQLQLAPPEADAYVCGSDQIWNPAHTQFESDEHVSWLDFGSASMRRIAYAASFGVSDLEADLCSRWAAYAERFHAVSVREEEGVGLLKRLGRPDAVWVPDPTFLLDGVEYGPAAMRQERSESPYLFAFLLGAENLVTDISHAVGKALHLNCTEVAPFSVLGFLQGGYRGPMGWLAGLRRSRFVVTDSFHGTAFSLIYHRPFISTLRVSVSPERNGRIRSLLGVVGLQSRAVDKFDGDYIEHLCREEIDWERVDARLRLFRETGCRFIRDALA